MSYARELYLKSLMDKAGSGGGLEGPAGPAGPAGSTGPTGPGSASGSITSLTGSTGPTGPGGTGGSESGSGIYANDTWLLNNLIGQAPAFSFGTPVSKTTAIYIPWTYPKQTRWTSTQLLPDITSFTQYIDPSGNQSNRVYIANGSSGNWIKNTTTDPSFVLVINKNSTSIGFSNITYTDSSGINYSAYGYSYYNALLVSQLGNKNTKNKITGWYSNQSGFGTTSQTSLTFDGFLAAGNPSQPTITSINSANVNSLTVNWTAPLTADTENTGQGSISSYDISYSSVGSLIRYPSSFSHSNLSSNGISGITKQITGLYPDSSYSFQILATNDSGGKGPYSSIFSGSTTNLTPIESLSNITFNVTSYTNGTIYYISNVSTKTGTQIQNSLLKNVDISSTVNVPIHRVNNRGKLVTSGTLMNLSAKLNTNTDASVNYTGFPITIPSTNTAGNVTIQTNSISDNYTNVYDQGFYLNATATITVRKEGFISGNTLNTISCSQSFTNNNGSNSTKNYQFYYDTPITQAPTGAINTITIAQSNFKQVSGIYVLQGTPTINIDASANNMGNYFYSSPLINYTCTIGTVNKTASESTLANVQSSDISNNATIIDGKLNFKSFITSNELSTFSKTVLVNATANNINGSGTLTSKSIDAITDGPSSTFVYTTLAQSIPTLSSSNVTGYRIWSAPTVSNNCPNLSANYKDAPYNNSWNINSTNNNGIDATTELQIYNGLFCTPLASASNAYIDYSSYLYNSSINYSTISTSGNRFASFCWKLPQSASAFNTLSFTINLISPSPTIINDYLSINGQQIQILYCFQDTATNTYSQSNFNSVWINANSNINTVSTSTYSNTSNSYGYYGAGKGASVSGSSSTIGGFIPAIPVPNTVYLYLRICIPMDKNISFGSVTSIVT